MSRSQAKVSVLHIAYNTTNRESSLAGADLRSQQYAYHATVIKSEIYETYSATI